MEDDPCAWIDKYMPQHLDDIIGNEDVVQKMHGHLDRGDFPNMLIVGPPGVGKTVLAHCLMCALYKDTLGVKYADVVLELNSSDDMSVNFIRTELRMFAQFRTTTLGKAKHKMVILDEADCISSAAQQSLRRLMEQYSNSTRFMLICNQQNNIVESIQSRCVIYPMNYVERSTVVAFLKRICALEKIAYNDDGIETIAKFSEGDVREALNLLQIVAYETSGETTQQVDVNAVYRASNLPPKDDIENLIKRIVIGDVTYSCEVMKAMFMSGFSYIDIIHMLNIHIRHLDTLDGNTMFGLLKVLGRYLANYYDGNDSQMQLYAMIAEMCFLSGA